MPLIQSYADADEFLHTRGKRVPRKKVCNSTYLHRATTSNSVDTISLRLHNTDVVTWTDDGLIILNTGGWLTVTTKDRINSVLPSGWHLVSDKGTWRLQNGWREASLTYRFQDGIQMRCGWDGWGVVIATACPDTEAERNDRHNSGMRKLIGKYLKEIDAGMTPTFDTGCTLCKPALRVAHPTAGMGRPAIVTYGDQMSDTQHLIDHMLDKVLPADLLYAALSDKGYLAHFTHGADTQKRTLRAYLSSRLFVGATAPVHGRRPALTGVPA